MQQIWCRCREGGSPSKVGDQYLPVFSVLFPWDSWVVCYKMQCKATCLQPGSIEGKGRPC